MIGIIDSGIIPESLSFADRVKRRGVPSERGRLAYQPLTDWAGTCVTGEEWDATDCNNKLIGAPLLQRRLGRRRRHRRRASVGVQLAARLPGPRHPHRRTAGGNYKTPTTGAAQQLGKSVSGMAPKRPDRRLQGALVDRDGRHRRRHHLRPRGRHRPGRRRRRRRHQLLDQRHPDQLPRPGRGGVPVRGRRRRLRLGLGGQQRPDRRRRWRTPRRGSPPSRRAPTRATARARSPSATATTYTGASLAAGGGLAPTWSTPRTSAAAGADRRPGAAVLLRLRRWQRPRPGQGGRQDRRLRSRRHRADQQEPGGQGGRRRRA